MTRTSNVAVCPQSQSLAIHALDLRVRPERAMRSAQRLSYLNLESNIAEEVIELKVQFERIRQGRFPNQFGPCPNFYSFRCCIQYLGVAGIGQIAQVCKIWNYQMKTPEVWKALFLSEGIPRVEEREGQSRDLREDFRILYPITIGSRKISVIGKVSRPLPFIREKWFHRLQRWDPFDEPHKLMRKTFVVVVMPSHLIQNDVEVPCTFNNLKVQCDLQQRDGHARVFHRDSELGVLSQFDTCPDTSEVYFMRKYLVYRHGYPSLQMATLKKRGFELTPLRVRALFDAVMILRSGTCPEYYRHYSWSYIRTPNPRGNWDPSSQVFIGHFYPGEGVFVTNIPHFTYDDSFFGVVSSVSVGV